MKAIFNPILNIHIAFGFAGMAAFWVAALSKKGSTPHIWVGRWYALVLKEIAYDLMPKNFDKTTTKAKENYDRFMNLWNEL